MKKICAILAAGTAIVMDSQRGYRLYDRGTRALLTGYVNDGLVKNILVLLAEARYAFSVEYIGATKRVTGL